MNNKRKFLLIIYLLLSVIIIGVTGYMMLLGVGFVDALYMTVITISTVGYGEVGVMTDAAKLFSHHICRPFHFWLRHHQPCLPVF